MRFGKNFENHFYIYIKVVPQIQHDEIINRDETSRDTSWIKEKSMVDLDNLPDPDKLAV